MPISRPSASSALAIAMAVSAGAGLAQDSARQKVEVEGDAAMQRVEDAVTRMRQRGADAKSPILPQPPPETLRRRAFKDLRDRAAPQNIDARARAALAAGEARMAAQREAMAKRLRQSLGLGQADIEGVAKPVPYAPTNWVPVLFVSSSMPVPVLRAYAQQLERVRGVLAFRGMPGGMRKAGPMARLTSEILRLDPGCNGPACAMRDVQVIIDPLVFRQHGVARVPALAMIPGDPTEPYCEREESSPRARFLVYGDSALPGLVDAYRRLGGTAEVRDVQARLGAR